MAASTHEAEADDRPCTPRKRLIQAQAKDRETGRLLSDASPLAFPPASAAAALASSASTPALGGARPPLLAAGSLRQFCESFVGSVVQTAAESPRLQ